MVVDSARAQIECIKQRQRRLWGRGGTEKPGRRVLLREHGVRFLAVNRCAPYHYRTLPEGC